MPRPARLACVFAGLALTALTACNTESTTNPDLSAQITCQRSVAVSDVSETVPPNSGPFGATFRVTNLLSTSNTATVFCSTTGNLTCSGGNPSVTLGPNASQIVMLHYTSGATNLKNSINATSCAGHATAGVRIL